ncbi:exodeoxyribonuclease VII small subunit [bacterium]|nr:exodeoxyribonuclease VII small subunit [bacterium]
MAKKNSAKESSATFETSLQKLESIVEALESGDVALDETLLKFEEGMKLVEFCHAKLDEAEKKLKILIKDKNGNLSIEDENV